MATVFGFESGRSGQGRGKPKPISESTEDDERLDELLSVDVIPRLLVAYSRPLGIVRPRAKAIAPAEIDRFVPLVLRCEAGELLDEVDAIMARGFAAEQLFVELLAPAARRLGDMWDRDELDFLQVAMGMWRLQEVLREIAARAVRAQPGGSPRTAIFTSMPGDAHTFGTAMVQECFALAGWNADLLVGANRNQILQSVAERDLDLVGLTLSHDGHIEPAASLIRAIRTVSMNPSLCIMVGGRLSAEQPAIATLVGADGTAQTAAAAVTVAEGLVCAARMAATA
jgi:MerR family transcriptional regulator, light-induced transcriptional regulator